MKHLMKITLILLTFITSYAQEITLDFSLYEDKYILLKLPTENAKDSLTFYFDTGAASTLLDQKIATKMGLTANYKYEVEGASGKKVYDMVLNQKIQLTQNKYIEGVHIVLDDLTRLKNTLGKDFDGIIGNDIIKNFITKIDFGKQQIQLYPIDSEINTNEYTEIPFAFKNNIPIPQFPIQIELESGEQLQGDILFDSGAGLSLLVNTPFKNKHQLLTKINKKIHSTNQNLSGKGSVTTTLIKKIQFSDFEFNNIVVELSSDTEGVSAYKDYLGILGSAIINRFDIVLNYKTLKMYLKPNHLFSNNFEIPVSPIKLAYSEEGSIVVSSVVENSEAEKKGLKEGCKIISINKIVSKEIEVYRKILQQENTKVVIEFLDNGTANKVRIQLKKLL